MEIRRGHVIVTTALLAVAAAGVVWAQGTAQATSTGTLAALTEEVRQLRLAVQASSGTQTQIQATTVYLSAEQSRMTQLSAKLDKVQTDLRARISANQATATRLKEFQSQLATATDQAARNELTVLIKETTREGDHGLDEETQLRTRESELVTMLQTEEARWQDLLARLDTLVKK